MKTTFEPHPKAPARRESAVTLIKLLLAHNTPTLSEHVEDLIDTLLWRITEADGKHNTVYRSVGALQCKDKSEVVHEHVHQRRKMIRLLVDAKPEEVDEIVKDAIGCLVTHEEHGRLNEFKDEYGWDRYHKAKIGVMDISEIPHKPHISTSESL